MKAPIIMIDVVINVICNSASNRGRGCVFPFTQLSHRKRYILIFSLGLRVVWQVGFISFACDMQSKRRISLILQQLHSVLN